MNLSTLLGLALGAGIIFFSITESGLPLSFFLEKGEHGIIIVVGGTLTVTLMGFSFRRIFSMFKIFFAHILGARRPNYRATIELILELNKKSSVSGPTSLAESIPSIKNKFLKEAVELIASGVMNERELRETLELRLKASEEELQSEAEMFATIGRFPPAFGLLAATLGMISLLTKLGEPGAEKLIGPAMAIGLVGTFYGIAIANFIFLPLAEALKSRAEEEMALRKIIVEGMLLIKKQANPMVAREALNSFVSGRDRTKRKAA